MQPDPNDFRTEPEPQQLKPQAQPPLSMFRRIRAKLPSKTPSRLVAVGVVLVVAAYGGYSLLGTHADTPVNPDCAEAVGPLKDRRSEVIQGNGKPYVPYGVTVPGLAHANYADFAASDAQEIAASAGAWCANTVRLQVAQDNLVGADGKTYSKPFMLAIKAEVAQAEAEGLIVVINAQTQDVGKEKGPTIATEAFWKAISGVYGHDPQVAFDLFNEPSNGTSNETATWRLWKNGGTNQGVSYLGMQTLVSSIRSHGATNLVWIEGPHTASTLRLVSSYTIKGGPLMYAIHHPTGVHNAAVWELDFGYLMTEHIAPVVVGEWTNYASTKSECWANAPTAVPNFLNFLQHNGIGLNVWTLNPGVMVQSSGDLTDPTRIKSDWKCKDGLNEGAGNQVMNWYKRQNS